MPTKQRQPAHLQHDSKRSGELAGHSAARVQRAFLIDGNSFCYRAYYAIRELTTSTGRPTNAIYGFITMLNALVDKETPEYLGVAFDLPKPTFRHVRFKEYKSHRQPMPETLVEQLPTIREVLEAMRIPMFTCEGFEADDVLATIALRIASPELQVIIVTGDKDALQLVGPHIRVLSPKPHEALYDEEAVRARFGVEPARMTDLMALMGDATDNIPAVPGVGEKTAASLLKEFGTFETLMRQVDQVGNPRVREQLKTHAEQAQMARELLTIDARAPLTVTTEQLRRQSPDTSRLEQLYRTLEFKTLLKKLLADDPEPMVTAPGTIETATAAQLQQAAAAPVVACVAIPGSAEQGLQGLALAWGEGACVWALHDHAAWRAIEPLLSVRAPRKIMHDWKQLKRSAARAGVAAEGEVFDTMLAAYLLNPAHAAPGIEDIAAQYLEQATRWESLPLSRAALGDAGSHALAAARALLAIAPRLEEALASKALAELYRTVEIPLSAVLAEMEVLGICVDTAALRELSSSMERELTRVVQAIASVVGHEVNLNSPRQLAQVLFEELKLPVVKRTKTGPSTDAESLAKLAKTHPLPAQLLTYRELTKLKSTYVDALPALVDPATHRLHTTWHQAVTATGRLSSSDPNLQNIPARTELGRTIRRAFIPGERGWTLLSADYSQIELRILAHLSCDATLQQAFKNGHDVHRFTASLIYGVSEGEVTAAMRNTAKTVNFGVIYGMQAPGLSRELGIGFEEAQAFIEAYFTRYPGVRRYAEEQVARAKQEGFVTTLLGRRRYIPELQSLQASVRQFGERLAMNAPIQGTAADLIKVAMVAIDRTSREQGWAARMLLQVHDELVFELPAEELPRVAPVVRQRMVEAMTLDVPIEVTLKSGPNWADLEAVASCS